MASLALSKVDVSAGEALPVAIDPLHWRAPVVNPAHLGCLRLRGDGLQAFIQDFRRRLSRLAPFAFVALEEVDVVA